MRKRIAPSKKKSHHRRRPHAPQALANVRVVKVGHAMYLDDRIAESVEDG
jgi:hypothetical protein